MESKPAPQAWGGYYGENPLEQVPAGVPVYAWNLAGYKHGHGPSGSGNRHTFGGLTDAGFRLIPLLEAGRRGDWPWLTITESEQRKLQPRGSSPQARPEVTPAGQGLA